MHYREVAEEIENTFGKKAHVATCHNELIKDRRFVLVGRGLYGLREWGYQEGTVLDVIKKILTNEGPLSRDEVVKRVLKDRYVKEGTVVVNLNNATHFKKGDNGLYYLA